MEAATLMVSTETETITGARGRVLGSALVWLLVVVFGALSLTDGKALEGGAMVVVGLFVFVGQIWQAVRPAQLIISEAGWTITYLWLVRSVRWNEVAEIGIASQQGVLRNQRRVGWKLRNSRTPREVLRRQGGFDGTFLPVFGKAEPLLATLETWRERVYPDPLPSDDDDED